MSERMKTPWPLPSVAIGERLAVVESRIDELLTEVARHRMTLDDLTVAVGIVRTSVATLPAQVAALDARLTALQARLSLLGAGLTLAVPIIAAAVGVVAAKWIGR